MGAEKAEPIASDFVGHVDGALRADAVVSAVESHRLAVFSEARFQFQTLRNGRPGDLYGTPALAPLEHPWPGGTTGDLLARMLLDADMAGNSYTARVSDELVRLRPDWVTLILDPRLLPYGKNGEDVPVGWVKRGFLYYEGGAQSGSPAALFLPDEVAHFAPLPDPLATYRGMSWLTPVIREVQADIQATKHKLKFFENAATPNLAVKMPLGPQAMTPKQFTEFVELMDQQHKGVDNAYKTLYTANGADVTVIGADMKQLDFKVTQGAGETRIAAAARVHPVLVGLSEGLAGSSLNTGNYQAAKRSFADGTMRPLWRNAAGSLEVIIKPPDGSRLWYDDRDVAYLREDQKDAAEIQGLESRTIRTLLDAGYVADSVVAAVQSGDWSLLKHSGLFSVQLQKPGQPGQAPPAGANE
jgi:hypothetical protein